jgi:hypothetical protein
MTPEQALDWLAEQHKSQCNEDRPVQEWIRSMKSMLPAPVQECLAHGECFGGKCIYTTPPAAQRQWVGLTDEQVTRLCKTGAVYAPDGVVTRTPLQYREELEGVARTAVRKAEAKLKEKNT